MRRRALPLAFALVLASSFGSEAGTVGGTVTIDGDAVAGAIVYLEGARETPPPPSRRVEVDQRNLAFVPGVLPVVRGTTVAFTNSDDVQHNVFTPSEVAGRFDLGSYARGEAREVTFDRPGEALILCNIHMEMQATIVVLRDPYFATTEAGGRYTIADVPPGSYTLKVWHQRWLSLARAVEVPGDGALTLDVTE
jgi:plastocyanin